MLADTAMYPVPEEAIAHGASQTQWLAGLAMQAILGRMTGLPDTEAEREEIALWSYRMAFAMKKMESRLSALDEEVE